MNNEKIKTIEHQRISRQVHFMLCQSCFWSVSNFAGGLMEKCPQCGNERLEVIPISSNKVSTIILASAA